MITHNQYLDRCVQLALLAKDAAPNPLVGAVLVYNHIIIGEGWHNQYGQAHAEVNCINSVLEINKPLIAHATLYVSLEPCNHIGKTPACTHLLLKNNIKKLVIGSIDNHSLVNGSGINFLLQNGVEVVLIEHENCQLLNKRFFYFNKTGLPYITLKWAQSKNGCIANNDKSPLKITNLITDVITHRWRSEEQAIMVGTTTLLNDNPTLNVRQWHGKSPIRIAIDMNLKGTLTSIFIDENPSIIYNALQQKNIDNKKYIQLKQPFVLFDLLQSIAEQNIHSVLVEGGSRLLQSFIDNNLWNEARIITNTALYIDNGYTAPVHQFKNKVGTQKIGADLIEYYVNQ
jgi:diaminohydroxyphosphoribosylaminopyrimidine deaminase/5-amino-6-(5-phosphoribosylamino)uracil reductase